MNSKARSKYQLGMLTEREEPSRYEMEGHPWKGGLYDTAGAPRRGTKRVVHHTDVRGVTMAAYDPSVIFSFADKLYEQAAGIEGAYAAGGAVVGGIIGAVLGGAVAGSSLTGGVIAAVIVGAIAWQIGGQKAAALRLQAQVALCQVQIEENTRHLRNE
jgi:hypothetical protein